MATYVVEIKLLYERAASTFGVFHSSSDTMFAPIFHEAEILAAHMFAAAYTTLHYSHHLDYSETAQTQLASDARAFLAIAFPNYIEHMAHLPAAWRAELRAAGFEESENFPFDSSDLLAWYENGAGEADVIQGLFNAWRRRQVSK